MGKKQGAQTDIEETEFKNKKNEFPCEGGQALEQVSGAVVDSPAVDILKTVHGCL